MRSFTVVGVSAEEFHGRPRLPLFAHTNPVPTATATSTPQPISLPDFMTSPFVI